eukprot:gene18253-21842_t
MASFFARLQGTFSSSSDTQSQPGSSPTPFKRGTKSDMSPPAYKPSRSPRNSPIPHRSHGLSLSTDRLTTARELNQSQSTQSRSFLRSSLQGLRRKFSIYISSEDDDEYYVKRSMSENDHSHYDGASIDSDATSSSSMVMFNSGSFRNVSKSNLKLKTFFLVDFFPEEIILQVLSFLGPSDLITVSLVNRRFYQLSNERTLWRSNCFGKNWITSNKFDPSFEYKSYYFEKAAINSPNCFKWVSPKHNGQLPSRRFKHTATCVNNKIIFIGGQETDTKRFNDIIYFDIDTQTFSKPSIKGDRVPNFSRHTASLVGKNIYIFGGFDGHGNNFDLSVYNTVNRFWTNIPKTFVRGDSPVSRTNHASVTVGSKVYIFGGNNNDEHGHYQVLDDLHVLDTETMTWTQPEVTGDKPCARSGHCMTAIGDKLYLFGGGIWNETNGWTDKFNDIHVLDTTTNHWVRPATTGDIHTSTFAISFAVGRFLFIFGGGSKPRHCVMNDIYILDTESFQWTVPSIEEPRPPARDMGTACVAGTDVYFMGGYAGGPIDYFNKLKFNYKVLCKLASESQQPHPNYSSVPPQGNSVM